MDDPKMDGPGNEWSENGWSKNRRSKNGRSLPDVRIDRNKEEQDQPSMVLHFLYQAEISI